MSIFDRVKSMFSGNDSNNPNWNSIRNAEEIEAILERSHQKPQLLYKHSNRCSVCWFAKSELEKSSEAIKESAEMHFVDVIKSREVSNYLAKRLGIRHESPQAIVVEQGQVIWHDSHGAIKGAGILQALG